MRRGAGEDKAVPQRVGPVADVAVIDERTDGVGETAADEEGEPGRVESRIELVEAGNKHPAEREVDPDEGAIPSFVEPELQHHAERGERPDSDEEPRPPALERDSREGRVGPGD